MPLMSALKDPFFVFYAVVLAVWLLRAKHALHTLKMAPRVIPSDKPAENNIPKVSVLVPARNEENNIRNCVESLLSQTCSNYEIIVINDNSTDRTEAILKELGAVEMTAENRRSGEKLRYLNAEPARDGWTGKNSALDQGVPFAEGSWFLFTDADTFHEPGCIQACLAHIEKNNLELLTLLPRCLTGGLWEDMIQPTAMCFTGLWFPIEKVNDPNRSEHFGNGQFLMMTREVYKSTGGHSAVKEAFLEDFALVKKAKAGGHRIQVALGIAVYGTRMYDSLASMWRGWRRIYLHAFESRWKTLAVKTAQVFIFSVMPFFIFPAVLTRAAENPEAYGFTVGFCIPVLTFIMGTAWRSYSIVRGKTFFALLHPIAAVFITGVFIDSALMAYTGKKTVWR